MQTNPSKSVAFSLFSQLQWLPGGIAFSGDAGLTIRAIPELDIEVLPSCIGPGQEAKHAPVIYGDYLMERIDKNYQARSKSASAA